MSEPVKPFACAMPECGMTFTNEDHLHVHTKKHDMVLQLGLEQKAAFVADQTPTPTRFIRNCEEVGLFQDLQNVAANPFDEGFKRAMETKAGILSLEAMAPSSDDVLHTPQMVFPLLEAADPTLFNTQRNITISRSSSDESGTIKEFETRTISKLTNEVTTISRIINNDDVTIKQTDTQKDIETVCYKNNVIRIESNIIKNNIDNSKVPVLVYTDSGENETNKNNVLDNDKLLPDKLPIMSQKSIDFVVDSLTSELETNPSRHVDKSKNTIVKFDMDKITDEQIAKIAKILKRDAMRHKKAPPTRILPKAVETKEDKDETALDYEVVIKLPDGKRVRMKPIDETHPKEIIRNRLNQKLKKPPNILVKNIINPVPKVVKIPTGTLIPVTLVNQAGTPLSSKDLDKVPITKINNVADIGNITFPVAAINKKTNANKKQKQKANTVIVNDKRVKVKKPNFTSVELTSTSGPHINKVNEKSKPEPQNEVVHLTEEMINSKIQEMNERQDIQDDDDDCVVVEDDPDNPEAARMQRPELERRSAASRRYRERLKRAMRKQSEENHQLREANQRLIAEKAVLKLIITEHMKGCPNAGEIANRLTALTNGAKL